MRAEFPIMQPHVLVSTDIVGLGDPRRVREVYEGVPQARTNGQIALEVLAWKWVPYFVDQLEKNYHLVGFHGQIGYSQRCPPSERAKEIFFNQALLPTQALLALAQEKESRYALVHESAAEKLTSQPQLLNQEASGKSDDLLLMVENIPQKGSLLRTANLVVSLDRRQPRPVGMMIDLAHALREMPEISHNPEAKQAQGQWDQVLFWLEEILPRLPIVGFHLPIGTTDNVPYTLELSDWQKLGEIMARFKEKIHFLVIENQHLFTRLRLQPQHGPILSSRTRRIMDKMQLAGVLPTSTDD